MAQHAPRGLIIAAPRSGTGKTTITLGLLRALRRRDVAVQPFKCGPDYIDPAFHAVAVGSASFNLDTWAMRPGAIVGSVLSRGGESDLCIVEGVMGLFDGAGRAGQCGNGSTADLAALTGWPVVLVLDVSAQMETAAAIALGCKVYRSDIEIAGVILNRVAGARHECGIAEAIRDLGMPVFGALRRGDMLSLPERHLGLLQAGEMGDIEQRLDAIADAIGKAVDIDALLSAAGPLRLAPDEGSANIADAGMIPLQPPGQRIALAQDHAFSFVYPHIVEGWRRAGADIRPFSPLADEGPPGDCDAVWLPGGYPELYAGRLSSASNFRRGMRGAAARQLPVHGECGGYMVLGAGLVAGDGSRHEMLGLLGLETSFAERRLHLGYRQTHVLMDGKGCCLQGEARGHEFHYATILANPDPPFAEIFDVRGDPVADGGARRGTVTGSFFHVIDAGG